MKTSFKSLLALAAFGATALITQAQTAPKILVLDIGKALQSYYKTTELFDALKNEQVKAGQQVQGQEKERNDLVTKYKELEEQIKNPAITKEKQAQIASEGEAVVQSIQQKEAGLQEMVTKLRREFAEREQNLQGMLVDDITKKGQEIGKAKGADLILPKNTLVYSNPAWEITDEVIAALNKDKPAGSTAKPATPAAAAPAAKPAGEAAPTVVFPGAKK
jgi:outer membrane protein